MKRRFFLYLTAVKTREFLIVGLGISGLCVAEDLAKRGRSFVVYDDDCTRSTSVAGGIVNPFALKRFKPAFRGLSFLRKSKSFFRTLEERLESLFYEEITIGKTLSSNEEKLNWKKAGEQEDLREFFGQVRPGENSILQTEHGLGMLNNIGRVNTKALLGDYHDDLKVNDRLIEEAFDTSEMHFKKGYWHYGNYRFKHIVFTEGVAALKNPLWQDLPIRPNKGEYLIFKAPELELDQIVKDKYFLIPLGKKRFKFGATYGRQPSSYKSDENSRQQLIEKLEKLIDTPFEPVRYEVGMRPTVKDHRPVLGEHRERENCFILNGTGSRGLLMAPSLAEDLNGYILSDKKIDSELSVKRFY